MCILINRFNMCMYYFYCNFILFVIDVHLMSVEYSNGIIITLILKTRDYIKIIVVAVKFNLIIIYLGKQLSINVCFMLLKTNCFNLTFWTKLLLTANLYISGHSLL